MTEIIVAIVFNFIIVIFVAFVVGKFLRDLMQGARSSASRNTSTHRQDIQNKPKKSVDNSRTIANSLQLLLKNEPAEQYRILRERLPERYHKELKTTFTSPQSKIAVIKFIRRKDIWPYLQDLQTTERVSSRNKSQRTNRSKKVTQESYSNLEQTTSYEPIEMEKYIDDFTHEYDGYGDYFDQLLGDISSGLQPPSKKVVEAEKITQPSDKKWLRKAIIASIILERPKH